MSRGQTNVIFLMMVSSLLLLWFKELFADVQYYFPAKQRKVITFLLRKQTFRYMCLKYVSDCAACVLSLCKKETIEGIFAYEASL